MTKRKKRLTKKRKRFEAMVLKLKRHPNVTNPWAMAHWMQTHGFNLKD